MSVDSVCPRCRTTSGFLNVDRCHWGHCLTCRTCWSIGSNLFSSWRDEDESIWQANAALLDTLEKVEPYEPPPWDLAWAVSGLTSSYEQMLREFQRVADVLASHLKTLAEGGQPKESTADAAAWAADLSNAIGSLLPPVLPTRLAASSPANGAESNPMPF